MKAPTSFPGRLLAGAALVGAGAGAGALAGWQVQAKNGQLAQATGATLGGAFGGMMAAFAGLLAANVSQKWAGVGDAAALVGFGGMTAMATVTAFGPNGVFGAPGNALAAGAARTPLTPGSVPTTAASAPVTGSNPNDDGGGGGSF